MQYFVYFSNLHKTEETIHGFGLTFNRQTGYCRPSKCTSASSKRENSVLQRALKFNGGLVAAEAKHLEGCTLKVNKAHKTIQGVSLFVVNCYEKITT
jgi:hypothetical protein